MNLDELFAAVQCKHCKGRVTKWLQCPRCGGPDSDRFGIDPDVIVESGPLRFNTMSIPRGVGAFIFVPLDDGAV